MPLGEAVAPPPGYTDLCLRGEASCKDPELAAADAAPTSAVFATASIGARQAPLHERAADAAEPVQAQFSVLQAYRPAIEVGFKPAGAFEAAFAAAAPVLAAAPVATMRDAMVQSAQMRMVNTINRAVNKDVHKANDFDLYGLLEYWSLPRVVDGKMYGDCEDYALEKRRRLIEAGLPAEALSMAVAVTARGESHAVLVVRFESGDWVLDNLTPWATPWEDLNYHWIQRQVAGSADWKTIG